MRLLITIAIALIPLLSQVPDSVLVGTVKSRAKIYSSPDTKSTLLHKLKKGTEVIVLSGQNEKFFQVRYSGDTGWLKFRHLANYKMVHDSVGNYLPKVIIDDVAEIVTPLNRRILL